MLGFNVIDLFIVITLVAWMVHGYRRGFLMSSIYLIAFITALLLATEAYPFLSSLVQSLFGLAKPTANLLSFLLLFGLTHFVLYAASNSIYDITIKLLRRVRLSGIDRLTGMLPSAIGGAIWIAIILAILSWFPINNYVKAAIADSRIGAPIVAATSVFQPQAEKIAGRAIDDTVVLITPREGDGEWKPNVPADAEVKFDPAAELFMLNLVSKERESRNLRPLMPDLGLRDVARAHSTDMVKNNFFDHRSPTTGYVDDRLLKARIFFLTAGENLAYAPDIELAHTLLMKSPGHRENILEQHYGKVGIGIVNTGRSGYMCTQVFTN